MADTGQPLFEVISPGMGMSIQDGGRIGWRRFGVPMGGVMDDYSARVANLLVDNAPTTPLLEMLMQGQRLRILRTTWVAIAGADGSSTLANWHAARITAGSELFFPCSRSGVWIYLTAAGGIAQGPELFGSASVSHRAGLGTPLQAGDLIHQRGESLMHVPAAVAGRIAPADEHREFSRPPILRVWKGPQWDWFSAETRNEFFSQTWQVSSKSDRVGYRLDGPHLEVPDRQLVSEPVRIGSIQLPSGGQPIVTLRDGPTVGGYPKLGMIDPRDLSWLTQCRPGQGVQFQPLDEQH